eukprot:898870-Rhodomonas_salina.1
MSARRKTRVVLRKADGGFATASPALWTPGSALRVLHLPVHALVSACAGQTRMQIQYSDAFPGGSVPV